jgi:hypothetical protein
MRIYKIAFPAPFEESADDDVKKAFYPLREQRINSLVNKKTKEQIEDLLNGMGYNKILGWGSFGVAYKLGDGKVAKITSSAEEYQNALNQMDDFFKSERLARIYAAEEVDQSNGVYLIITDEVKLLTKTQQSIYNDFYKLRKNKSVYNGEFKDFVKYVVSQNKITQNTYWPSIDEDLRADGKLLTEIFYFFKEIIKCGI